MRTLVTFIFTLNINGGAHNFFGVVLSEAPEDNTVAVAISKGREVWGAGP